MSAPAVATPIGVKPVQDLDRGAVRGEHRVEALVGRGRLVGRPAAQLDAGGRERPLDVVEVDQPVRSRGSGALALVAMLPS